MSGAMSHHKGARAEREIAGLLADQLGYPIRRKLGAGRMDDEGDLEGFPDGCAVVQVANWADALRAVRQKPVEAEQQRINAGATFAATAVRLRGGSWRVVMTVDQFCTWAREAIRQ